MAKRVTDFEVLTFDCYGTLIDWERGILAAIRPWMARHGITADDNATLELFGTCESAAEAAAPDLIYPEILARSLKAMAAHWGKSATDADAAAFGASVPDWPAFPDSAEALQYLKRHYKLVILSNVDRQSFAASNRKLGVEFDAICTAQDIGSYKPSPRNFAYLLEKLGAMGIAKEKILHTAQSLFHDHVPATKAGLATCWIDRRHAVEGWGATPAADRPAVDFHLTSMADLVRKHQEERRG